jgi:hypothetical protein
MHNNKTNNRNRLIDNSKNYKLKNKEMMITNLIKMKNLKMMRPK